ncbi:MAG: group II intron reverse transcriptase/maturase [Candidatus Eisenbacteria bacterium]|nr:group II intron reverse transcriptase/maturase [Candidatus Eisenbacteria bacterium]
MKESYTEGPANHSDPESCAGTRKGAGEALTGAHTGGILSRETRCNQGADDVVLSGRQHTQTRQGKCSGDPARSQTSSTCGNSMRENREIPCSAREDGKGGKDEQTSSADLVRAEKADGRNPAMHGHGKSDRPIRPAKLPNNVGRPMAEAAEGRGLTKENADQRNTPQTQGWNHGVPNGLDRVRQAALRCKKERFSALFHHITVERLRDAFFKIKKNAAPGVDGVMWAQYGEDLEKNLQDFHKRLHRGAYRAKPSRRAYIPKSDGRQRPLGIAALEDKIVQRAAAEVLNAIYEVDFLGFSYGFRPGRRAHEALDALAVGIRRKKISWILDADIRGYFGSISHNWMIKFLEHRIADRRMLRLIRKWLKAGVIENGVWAASDEGSPQGASISPLLANVYLHYALDLWVQWWRKHIARGEVIIVRWADDFVMGFQYEAEARQFLEALRERLRNFSLELHPDKTRLIRFGRFARRDVRRFDGRKKPETFDFLGFTHFCGVNRNGKFMVGRITMKQRFTAKLQVVKAELRRRMHDSLVLQGLWLRSVVQGYFAYHAIPGNWDAIGAFRTQVARLWYRTLRRRSQKTRLNWDRMKKHVDTWLPPARILHPWPDQRFDAMIRGKSPVR